MGQLRQIKLIIIACFFSMALEGLFGQVLPPSIPNLAPSASDQRPVVSMVLEPAILETGQTGRLVATLVIPAGLHLVRQEGLFDLAIKNLPAGLSPGVLVLPAPSGQIAGTDIYTGTLRVELPLTITQPVDSQPIQVSLTWQICYDTGICLRPATELYTVQLTTASHPGLGFFNLLAYLGLAVLGGLLLNFMPCVLPVLSLKAMALVGESGSAGRRRHQGLAMVAGIMASMLVLAGILVAFQAGGNRLGWGFQFQSPWYTLILTAVVFVLGLSLFEVWNLPQIQLRRSGLPANQAGGSLPGNFGSGMLTVLLATPCTAPFLGTALGFALAAPPGVLVMIFAGIGLGLALPFGLVVLLPGKGLRLPKPGPWLGIFREIMAFSLMATVVWLLSVLVQQVDLGRFVANLGFLVALALLLRAVTWVRQSGLRNLGRRVALVAILVLGIAACWGLVIQPASQATVDGGPPKNRAGQTKDLPAGWLRFDETAISRELAAGQGVFIDFTAAWCLTCKLNEAGALADPGFLQSYRAAGISLYRGDYTNPDPVITSWLQRYQRAGVPFYLLMRPGKPAQVLPELLTPAILSAALAR